MFELEKLVRPNILSLKPYSSARDDFKGSEGVFLDANENPFGMLNRYPDPTQKELKKSISALKKTAVENIFVGNGSDEVIDILFRIFCDPGKDKVIICPPTYGMYEVSANINNVNIISIPLDEKFQLNTHQILNTEAKMIFLCTPNNPTGNVLNEVEEILKQFNGIVIVDEAYIDFSEVPSFSAKLNKYPNLVVMQTLSKAWGLAAARVGIAFASTAIISLMNKVKPPYNVSALNQNAAIEALTKQNEFQKQKELILTQRAWLHDQLLKQSFVKTIHPSDANFLLVEVTDADAIYNHLVRQKVITRNRNSVVKNCIRITVGTSEENKKLIEELKKY